MDSLNVNQFPKIPSDDTTQQKNAKRGRADNDVKNVGGMPVADVKAADKRIKRSKISHRGTQPTTTSKIQVPRKSKAQAHSSINVSLQQITKSPLHKANTLIDKMLNEKTFTRTSFNEKVVELKSLAESAIGESLQEIQKETDPTKKFEKTLQYNNFIEKLHRVETIIERSTPTHSFSTRYKSSLQQGLKSPLSDSIKIFDVLHEDLTKSGQEVDVKSLKGEGAGVNPSFLVLDSQKSPLGIIKLASQEANGTDFQSKCFKTHGGQAIREFACSYINMGAGFLINLPITFIMKAKNDAFTAFPNEPNVQLGSCQMWEHGAKELTYIGRPGDSFELKLQGLPDFADTSILSSLDDAAQIPIRIKDEERTYTGKQLKDIIANGEKAFKEAVNTIPLADAQGLMAFHILVGALDEQNCSNTMYKDMPTFNSKTQRTENSPTPIAIDKGFSLPDLSANDWCGEFLWANWSQAKEPFCNEVSQKIASMNIDQIIAQLDQQIKMITQSTGLQDMAIDPNVYIFLRAQTIALKEACTLKIPIKDLSGMMKAYVSGLKPILFSKAYKDKTGAEAIQYLENECRTKIHTLWANRQKILQQQQKSVQ